MKKLIPSLVVVPLIFHLGLGVAHAEAPTSVQAQPDFFTAFDRLQQLKSLHASQTFGANLVWQDPYDETEKGTLGLSLQIDSDGIKKSQCRCDFSSTATLKVTATFEGSDKPFSTLN